MSFKINDTVKLTEDIPQENLKAGTLGVVIEVFSEPHEAYEIEFIDNDAELIAQLALLSSQITLVNFDD